MGSSTEPAQEAKTVSDIQEITSEVGIIQAQIGDLMRKLGPVSFGAVDSPKDEGGAPKGPASPVRNRLAQLLLQVKEAKRTLNAVMGALDI